MALSAFPYIGGKTALAGWIEEQFPDHTVYVEPFGGSASVLLNKSRSDVEVYNDLDGDVVHLFEVVRERTDELAEWVAQTPYSEELHQQWADEFYGGERPDDDVERAGRFIFLRYSQFAGKYRNKSGFKIESSRSRVGEPGVWAKVPEKIRDTCRRLQGVTILDRHFGDVIEKYDDPETVFYCDPPYLDKSHYRVDDFSHQDLDEALAGIEGDALVSYTDRPGGGLFDGWREITREHYHDHGAKTGEQQKEVTERLLVNFDPDDREPFLGDGQVRLGVATDGGARR